VWLLLSPTRLEAPFLEGEPFAFLAWRGLKGTGFVYLETGIGKVNAAMALAAYAARNPVEKALLFGLAGAYPGGPSLGEAVLVEEEVEADLGLKEGLAPLGFPALALGERRYFNRFPLDPGLTGELARGLGLKVAVGLTRDLVSETPEEALALARRWGACLALGVRGAELRALSNPAGVRDKAHWRTKEALSALARAVRRLLAEEGGARRPPG